MNFKKWVKSIQTAGYNGKCREQKEKEDSILCTEGNMFLPLIMKYFVTKRLAMSQKKAPPFITKILLLQ